MPTSPKSISPCPPIWRGDGTKFRSGAQEAKEPGMLENLDGKRPGPRGGGVCLSGHAGQAQAYSEHAQPAFGWAGVPTSGSRILR